MKRFVFLFHERSVWMDEGGSCLVPGDLLPHAASNAEVVTLYPGQAARPHLLIPPAGGRMEPRAAGQWVSVREVLVNMAAAEQADLARAYQLYQQLQKRRFCPACGTRLALRRQEVAMECQACGHIEYPRISPCIMALVTDGDRLLLIRGPQHKPGMYSCVAGFVEAGETVEDALHREVKEETGVDATLVQYVGSQSWPFPDSLMLGFIARYQGGAIQVERTELEDADWFTVNQLPELPPEGTLSRRLIDSYLTANL